MEFPVLGPLEVRRDGRSVELRGSKRRAVLAILLLHANEVVRTDRLIDELWSEDRSGNASAALLALWRGPALADLAREPALAVEIACLEELRLSALEQRIDADLELGSHAELAHELPRLYSPRGLDLRPGQ